MSTLLDMTSKDALSAHVASLPPSALLVLYFYTPWTAFSTRMTNEISALASQYPATTPPTLSFVSINGKQLVEIAKEYGVSTAPYVICLRDGEILESIRGSDVINVRKALDRHSDLIAVPVPTLVSKQDKEALMARLADLVQAAPVMLFMKGTPESPQCRFGRHIVRILQEHGIDYDFFNVLSDETVRQGLKEFADWPTYPQLWVDGALVGGLDIAREEINANPGFWGQYSVSKPIT